MVLVVESAPITCNEWLTEVVVLELVLESLVRSGYLVPQGSNRDRDRLGFVPRPKITGPDRK